MLKLPADPVARARAYVLLAAVLWSLSGPLAKTIALPGPTMASIRALFAGLALLPLLRWRVMRFRPAMIGMVICFTTMNACYVSAIMLTSAANAIFLQYTAPVWMFVACVLWLGEPLDRRSLISMIVALAGMTLIVWGGVERDLVGISLALVAGVNFGIVAVFLRMLRDEDAIWMTFLNHFLAGALLMPLLFLRPAWSPLQLTAVQWIALAVFGAVQMALPYILFSRGVAVISPQEAGIIALLEPVLNPILTYIAVREQPATTTLIGGSIILGGVLLRYIKVR